MSRLTRSLSLPGVIVLLAQLGCYAESPLDPSPRRPVDKRLLGEWRCIPMDATASDTARVTVVERQGPDRQFEITWREADRDDEQYRAFTSDLHGSLFLNVGAAESPNKKEFEGWAFVRYTFLRPNILRLEFVPERVFKGKEHSRTPDIARQTLKSALKATPPGIDDWAVCVRELK